MICRPLISSLLKKCSKIIEYSQLSVLTVMCYTELILGIKNLKTSKKMSSNLKQLRRNPPDFGVTSGQKSSTKIIYIVLQTSVGLF